MSEWTATDWTTRQKEDVFKRLTTLETQAAKNLTIVTLLTTSLDTLTDKLIEAGVLVKSEAEESLDRLNKEMWFISGIHEAYMPKDSSLEERFIALVKNQFELDNRIDTLRTHILDLDRRLRNSEAKKGKWWNR